MYDFETLLPRKNMGSVKWDDPDNHKYTDENIVPFTIADMEFKTSPEIIEGLKTFLDDAILGYTLPYTSYLKSVKSWMSKRHKFEIDLEWIISTQGVIAAISAAVRGFTEEGDGVIIMPPVYYPFSEIITNNNRNVVGNRLIETDGYYSINFEELEILAKN
ncbi:MAG: aminotransferase class I/II-fold pyridoxal phosphate-dependent enzyme, partial [Acholeplasma sp.]|nr:aminotransferase class I/II-fold pyridoxal phosphate-dependent enzyme [Acholeplasma sp.]